MGKEIYFHVQLKEKEGRAGRRFDGQRATECYLGSELISQNPSKPDLVACVCSPRTPVERSEETGEIPDIFRPASLAVHNVRHPESCFK